MKRTLIAAALALVAVLALVIGGVAVAVSMQPDALDVERSVRISASAADVHAAVSDYRAFNTWSPWDYDPDMAVEYSDPSSGEGAWYTWKGNDQVGSGRMETTSDQPLKIEQDLEFIEPFAGQAVVTYTLEPSGDTTTLTWNMHQDLDFMGKAMGLIMDMDGMIGADFEKGLGRVKSMVEGGELGAPDEPVVDEGEARGAAAGGASDTDSTEAAGSDTDVAE